MDTKVVNSEKYLVNPDWADTIEGPEDVEMQEVKILVPKIIWDRFSCSKTFNPSINPKKAYSVSKRLTRYLMRYHALLRNKEVKLLESFINLKEIDKMFREFDEKERTKN